MTMTISLFAPRTEQHVTISVPAHRPTRLGSNVLLALGTLTLAQVMAPTAAQRVKARICWKRVCGTACLIE